MNCNQCVHNKVCMYKKERIFKDSCSDFRDLSKYIEVPFAIGSNVYRLAHGYINQEVVRGYSVCAVTNGYGFNINDVDKFAFEKYEDAVFAKEQYEKN